MRILIQCLGVEIDILQKRSNYLLELLIHYTAQFGLNDTDYIVILLHP